MGGMLRLGVLLFLYVNAKDQTAWYTNIQGAVAIDNISHNPSENVCLGLLGQSPFFNKSYPPWQVVTGTCTIDSEGCFVSPNYPSNYDANSYCAINMRFPAHFELEVESFDTEIVNDKLTVNGKSYSGSTAPYGVVPRGHLEWQADGNSQHKGWKLCAGKDICYPAIPVRELWKQGEVTGQAIVITYLGAAALLAVSWLLLLGCSWQDTSTKAEILKLATQVDEIVLQKGAHLDCAADVAQLSSSFGKNVKPMRSFEICPPGGVRVTLMFIFLDVALHFNTAVWLLLEQHYVSAGIIFASVLGCIATEAWNGNLRQLPSELADTLQTGVLTDGFLNTIDRVRGLESLACILTIAYVLPFAAKNPYQVFTSLMSLLVSTWMISAYNYEQLDLAFEDDIDAPTEFTGESSTPLCKA